MNLQILLVLSSWTVREHTLDAQDIPQKDQIVGQVEPSTSNFDKQAERSEPDNCLCLTFPSQGLQG